MKYDHRFDNSSMFQSAHYDNEAKELTIIFMNSKEYVYEDVPKMLYDELISSDSAGKYFNSIKSMLAIKKSHE